MVRWLVGWFVRQWVGWLVGCGNVGLGVARETINLNSAPFQLLSIGPHTEQVKTIQKIKHINFVKALHNIHNILQKWKNGRSGGPLYKRYRYYGKHTTSSTSGGV